MTVEAFVRIVGDLLARGARELYWELTVGVGRVRRLWRLANRHFRRQVGRDLLQYVLNGPTPIQGETRRRARAAADWLFRAHDAGGDDGVSQGYFFCDEPVGWRASYPETTGYIISTLLEFAQRYGDRSARERAIRMARWEIGLQMPTGAVQAGIVSATTEQTPAVFNTGMVLDGWCSAYHATGDESFLKAADRAADFLLVDQGEDGHFRTHGTHVVHHDIKTYNCLCAWALYRHAEQRRNSRYRDAATVAVEAALREQRANGWFAHNCMTRPDAPLLHSIGYTLQGILKVGVLAGRRDFVAAVVRGVDPILARMSSKGFLHGRFYSDWTPASLSSCLTGSAQIAVVCYRLHEVTRRSRYRAAADTILNYLKPLQVLDSPEPAINGALGGSFPLLGSYMTGGYPNWATKYLLDALMLQDGLAGTAAAPMRKCNHQPI